MDVRFLTPSECSFLKRCTPAIVMGHLADYDRFQALDTAADQYVRLSAHTEILAPLLALAEHGSITIHRHDAPPLRVESPDRQPMPNIDELLDDALHTLDPTHPVLDQVVRFCRLRILL